MKKQFMLDIETTGIDPSTEVVLQIAVIEMNFTKKGLWEKGRKFEFYQHTPRQPETEFAKTHMQEIYARCNKEPETPIQEAREMLLKFFRDCGAEPPNVYICGWNVGIFDLPFLAHHGYLMPARYDNGVLKGDCHYRTYEISGALQLMANLRGKAEVNPIIKESEKREPAPTDGNRHNAMFDCERQVNIINGLLKMGHEYVASDFGVGE